MVNKYIFMVMLCMTTAHILSMEGSRFGFSRGHREAMVGTVHLRSQAMHEEGIVPNHDLITLDSMNQSNQECLECGPERIERNFFYSLGCLTLFAQYGPSVCAAFSL